MSSDQAQESVVEERGLAPAGRGPGPGSRAAALHPQSGAVGAQAELAGVLSGQLPLFVYKFGGSSLAGADRILHAAALVRDARRQARLAVVVSAMRGVTDRLLSIAQSLVDGAFGLARAEAEFLIHLHNETLRELHLNADEHAQVQRDLHLLGRDLLQDLPLQGKRKVDAALFDRLASFGERFSARLFAAALAKLGVPASPVVSSDFLLTSDEFRNAKPDIAQSKRNGREVLRPLLEAGIVPVVTGFIGAARDGRITTLGRNSSDYSGAIVAHVLDANELVIWTDVDGIYTANSGAAPDARLLSDVTYAQAYALAASGAKVLHAEVLPLAAKTRLVVWVRNTFKPHARGTRIGPERAAWSEAVAEGAA